MLDRLVMAIRYRDDSVSIPHHDHPLRAERVLGGNR